MSDFSIITNQKLRELAEKAASIQSLDEEQRNALIEQIAQLPEAGQNEMIELLENEAATLASGKILSSAETQQKLVESLRTLKTAKKSIDKEILVAREQNEVENSNLVADQLLQKL